MQKVSAEEFAETIDLKRPQSDAPSDHPSLDVRFESNDGVELAGTISYPGGDGSRTGVVLLSGSGSQDRDGNIYGHKPLKVIADELTARGYVVLRFDDRGFARSDGRAGPEHGVLVSDAEAAMLFLRKSGRVTGRTMMVGHSEGGLVAMEVAAKHPEKVKAVVAIGMPAMEGNKVLAYQAARRMGKTEADVDVQRRAFEQAYEWFSTDASVRPDEAEALRAWEEAGRSEEEWEAIGRAASLPWLGSFLETDPIQAVRSVEVPTLVIYGELDAHVPVSESVQHMRDAQRSQCPDQSVTKLIPGVNHLMQTASTGSVEEYIEITETVSPVVLRAISEFLDDARETTTVCR